MEDVTWIAGTPCYRVTGVSMETFIRDNSSKRGVSSSFNGKSVLNSISVTNYRGICISWVCVCVDYWDVASDASGGWCTEDKDTFIFGSLIKSLFIWSESLSYWVC